MKPILLDLPDTIETERLVVRCARPGDGEAINAAVAETFDELHRWMPWCRAMPTLEESEEFSRQMHAKFLSREDFGFRFFERSSGSFAGSIVLHPRGWEVPKFEIGYWCRARFVGRGYVSEAVRALVDFAGGRLGAKRIEIRCDERNERSRRVAERCGFVLEGRFPKDAVAPDGVLRTTLVLARTA
jgi:RimJ/RimL family protein N-acetyltransferase